LPPAVIVAEGAVDVVEVVNVVDVVNIVVAVVVVISGSLLLAPENLSDKGIDGRNPDVLAWHTQALRLSKND